MDESEAPRKRKGSKRPKRGGEPTVEQSTGKEWREQLVQRRDERRHQRANERLLNTTCYNCRKTGHMVADCTELKADSESGVGVCFKCGSTEHRISACKSKVNGFPFAKCFVCSQVGHLSRECKQNDKGIYPDGGCCKLCGSVAHLKKDCPKLRGDQEEAEDTLREAPVGKAPADHVSADADDALFLEQDEPPKKSKRSKVVLF